jgi:hypothetical protein
MGVSPGHPRRNDPYQELETPNTSTERTWIALLVLRIRRGCRPEIPLRNGTGPRKSG